MQRSTFRGILVGLMISTLSACAPPQTQLEQVKQSGELTIITRNAANTYYEGPGGPAGLEYDLASLFAKRLGAELNIIVADNLEDIFIALARGEAQLAAAGLTQTTTRNTWIRFTPPYQQTTQQVVYRAGNSRPRNPQDLADGLLEVVAHSSHSERLRELKMEYPELDWVEATEQNSEELLSLVSEQMIDYTIIDSNELMLNRRFYPLLQVAFAISDPQPMAWAFPRIADDTLYREAVSFFEEIEADGTLAQLLDRHYGHIGEFDYVGTTTFLSHIQQRLPEFRDLFQTSAAKHNFDWRLIASMGYQESHWNPRAVSPTGVRGIMMLTRHTAAHLGIKKRTDPAQSIKGGTRYLRYLKDKLPESIKEPDRTWMALASYNVGFGHLEDARKITIKRGGDPDKWVNVKESLPLLRKRKWYKPTRYGYARGDEAVHYVENIRSYYEIMLRILDEGGEKPVEEFTITINSPIL